MELVHDVMIIIWWTCGLMVGFLFGTQFQKQTNNTITQTKKKQKDVPTKSSSSSSSDVLVEECSNDSIGTQTTDELEKRRDGRYLELLVHNVSHTDLVLGMTYSEEKEKEEEEELLGRPRFSAFDSYCQRIQQALTTTNNTNIRTFPRVKRSHHTPHYTLSSTPPTSSSSMKEPVGFQLGTTTKNVGLDEYDFHNLRIRGSDVSKLQPHHIQQLLSNSIQSPRKNTTDTTKTTTTQKEETDKKKKELQLNAVYFPLLSCLMRRWNTQIANKFPQHTNNVQRVIILVTGVGTPRNYTHDLYGNSTKQCAQLMETYIQTLYPNVQVVRIHSETNIFRYDENITFTNDELMPCIDAYRDAHARGQPYPTYETDTNGNMTMVNNGIINNTSYDPDWKQSFHVTLSFADGSPARTHAIQSSLRPYRPTYFHFWQLKTFWHESKICDDDIEEHSFEEMETVPAMEASLVQNVQVQRLVHEMNEFKQYFLQRVSSNSNSDIANFWLRKSKKPVLAVLLVHKPGKGLVIYRGTNMEVSMPTGSLCAERNVIGTALAMDPGLRREDLRMVAVLAVPLKTLDNPSSRISSTTLPLTPYCLPANDELDTDEIMMCQSSNNKDNDQPSPTYNNNRMARSLSFGSFASIVEEDNDDDYNPWYPKDSKEEKKICDVPKLPVRRIKLHTKEPTTSSRNGSSTKKKKTVIVHSHEDINPLKPCGACNEWLKKIAECNPHFKVVTFTDADCNGVYVTPCQE